jgi:hypothetical protein
MTRERGGRVLREGEAAEKNILELQEIQSERKQENPND